MPGDEVEREEAPAPERLLDDAAEPVEREHVEGEVEQARVEEHRRHEPVPLAVEVDRGADERAVEEQLPARLRRGRRRPGATVIA